ncbi:hypothetical protein VKT23_019356 [Stygiomarasmius scandens]|uniref:Vomeronasal type-1 receptor n=1 Tax=Marasmiellus scandens TaxID=2682957 RepID=A0ABR1ILN5_9AGAR
MSNVGTSAGPSTDGIDISPSLDGLFYGGIVSFMHVSMQRCLQLGLKPVFFRMFGVTIVQSWTYANKNHDPWALRSFVAVLVVMDLASTIMSIELLHFVTISNWGNLDVFTKPTQYVVTSKPTYRRSVNFGSDIQILWH